MDIPRTARKIADIQEVPAKPSSAVRSVLQRVPGKDGAEYRQRPRARARLLRWGRRSHGRPAATAVKSTRLTDDVLADIQGFITSGYGHLSHAAYLFVQFHDPGNAQRWLRRLTPEITSARPWQIAPNGEKVQADGGAEHRLQRRRPRGPRVATAGAVHLSPRVPGGKWPLRGVRESLEIRRRAIPSNGNWAAPGRHPSMRSLSFMRCRKQSSKTPAAHSARFWTRPREVSSNCPAACRQDAGPTAITSRSGFTTASRSRRLRASAATAYQPASSSSATRTTSRLFHRHRSSPRNWIATLNFQAGQPLSRPAARRSRHQRLLRRVPQATAGCRGILAVHETRIGSTHGRRG